MALAENNHHTAPRRQTTARAGGEARDALHGHVLDAPLPQGRVLRHVVGHLPVPALENAQMSADGGSVHEHDRVGVG